MSVAVRGDSLYSHAQPYPPPPPAKVAIMRHAAYFTLFAVLLAITTHSAQAEEPAAPPKPLPIQVQTDKTVVETAIGTDLTSRKAIEEQAGLKLLWNGKDIPPLCFNKLVMGEAPLKAVDLGTCGQEADIKVTKTYLHDGQLISDYRYNGAEADEPDMSVMYHVIGDTAEGTAIEVSSYTGGSGRFTGINFVKIEGSTLKLVKSLGGGDRCNGGVADAEIKDDTLVYGFYITPADFTTLALGDDQGLVPYEDLEASASSCFGIARYEDRRLVEVELLPDAPKAADAEWTGRYALQRCFNEFMVKKTAGGKTILKTEAFKAFVTDFMNSCKKA